MNVSNFTNPLTVVQTITIWSYYHTLGDFLHTENFLAVKEKKQLIPIVNSLCHYLEEHNHNHERKSDLIRQLLRGSNLYGEDADETPDDYFVNTLLDHIISYPVSRKYVNKYGLLAEIARSTEDPWMASKPFYTIMHLSLSKFGNKYGLSSSLDKCSLWMIFYNLISTLFPAPMRASHLIPVDYIYAQAGLIFSRPVRIGSAPYSHEYTSDTKRFARDNLISEKLHKGYTAIGIAVEQLVIAGKLDESALRIFALPALLYYVSENKKNLGNVDIKEIIDDPDHWTRAYRFLFSNLNEPFGNAKNSQNSDQHYRFQGYNDKFNAINLRESIRKTLKIRRKESILNAVNFSRIIKKYMLNNSKIDSFRLLDPSFELAHDLGLTGLKSIRKVVRKLGKQFKTSLKSTERTLRFMRIVLTNSFRKLGVEFGVDVHVKSLSRKNKSGYGYKFVYLPDGKIAELRKVQEFDSEVPVVLHKITRENENIYRAVVPTTGQVIETCLHIESSVIPRKIRKPRYIYNFFEGVGNIEETGVCQPLRSKRSPGAGSPGCRRALALQNKLNHESEAIQYAKENGMNKKEEEIREELRKYVFPEKSKTETEMEFVKAWVHDKKIPAWSKKYEIKEPEIFFFLRYQEYIEDVEKLTLDKARSRIRYYFELGDDYNEECEGYIKELWEDYMESVKFEKIHRYVNFEDYISIFELKVGSRRMKILDEDRSHMSLYRLAIRQSDDQIYQLPGYLYKMEMITTGELEELRLSKECVLEKFTVGVNPLEVVAENFDLFEQSSNTVNDVPVVFEMKFEGKYPRVLLDDPSSSLQEIIIFPGTEFRVDNVLENAQERIDLGIGPYVKIEGTIKPFEKHEWQQKLMMKIGELKDSDSVFYFDDEPKTIDDLLSKITSSI